MHEPSTRALGDTARRGLYLRNMRFQQVLDALEIVVQMQRVQDGGCCVVACLEVEPTHKNLVDCATSVPYVQRYVATAQASDEEGVVCEGLAIVLEVDANPRISQGVL